MKKIALLLFTGLLAFTAKSQELPVPSPKGEVEQMVGLTEVEIEYSRPSAKGRKIFGELVPYGKLWRLGANMSTKLTISTPISIEGREIAKGEYSILAIPGEGGDWVIIINSDPKLRGTSGYEKAKDVLRIDVKAVENSFNETFTIGFNNVTATSAVICIKWENLRVDVPFTVDTDKLAKESIQKAIKKGKDLDKVYGKAASYYHDMKDYKTAMMYINKSLKTKKTHSAMYTKARILKAEGKKAEAIKTAEEALKLANEAESKGWASYIESTITKWKK